MVCDWSGCGGDRGKSHAVGIAHFVITVEIEEHSEESLCYMSSPHSLRKPTDPEGSWLAHPPRQPGPTLREER